MLQFPFYLLFFLNFFTTILSTNPPCKFVLNEINEFNKEFKDNLEIFNQKIFEIGGRKKVQEILGHRFSEAIFRNEFPGEIGKMKIEVEKYLRGNKPFREIFNEINGMRMDNEKLKELEMLKSELDEAKREHHILSISTLKTLELVELLGGMHVSVNKFIAETFVKLQTRQMMEHFDELGRQIQRQKIILGAPYAEMMGKYGPEGFAKIAEIIKREKAELLEEYWNPDPPLPETIFKNKDKLPAKCTQNMDKLRSAFDEKNPRLEKVELNVPGPNISLAPEISQLNEHLQKIGKYLDHVANELPQLIEQEKFFAEKQQEFANLHARLDDLQLLNIAFIQMYNRIRQVVFFEVWEKQLFARLTDIQWLREYIAEKLDQMNAEAEERHRRPFLSVAEAREKQELPRELEFEGKEMNDPREVAFLIGENLLFIAAQMGRMHNFKDAIETMYFEKPMESHKDVRLLVMVNVKNLPPQQIGQFFYEKYLEKIKKDKTGGDKLSEGMEKMKIGEAASSSKSGHAAVGESSSTKIGENEEGVKRKMYSEAKAQQRERELEEGIHLESVQKESKMVDKKEMESKLEEIPKTTDSGTNQRGEEKKMESAEMPARNVAPLPSTSNPKIKKSAWSRLNKIEPTSQEVTLATDSGPVGSDSQQQSRKKFRTIAKGLSLMSRVRTGDMAMSREQQAFFSKYGISTADEIGQREETELGGADGGIVRRRGAFWALFNWEGMSKWEFFINKLVLDPYKDYYYNWLGIVTAAYLYNLLFIVYRSVFIDVKVLGPFWLGMYIALDIFTDLIYLLDNYVRSRTGYLDQGLLVKDVRKVIKRYEKGKVRWLDLAGSLPFDYLFQIAFHTPNPCFRFNRLLKLDRVLKFVNTTEMRVSKPNFFRVSMVFLYILILIHWNACFYYFISTILGIDSDRWVYGKANLQALPEGVEDTLSRRYLYSFYWSTLMLSNVCEVPWPVRSAEFIIVCADLMFGVLIFATIVGNVGSMITNSGAARSQFQARIDNVKNFLKIRSVGKTLVNRISKWFDYLWQNNQAMGQDHEVLEVLPTKLQAEIAMHVHFETLRKVRLFQDCEAGLLGELVLKLELQVFSPMDYVCRKGDVGREMYIVKRGRLQVVADDGVKVLHTLLEGAVFGELSLLNIPGSKHGNRRSASIRSVGYTDLFVLKKADLWEALREYPEAKTMLVQKGREMLQKDGLLDENAPLEEKGAEKRADEVREYIERLQEKLARLTAEYLSAETKLQARVDFLESEMKKYGIADSENEEEEFGEEGGPIGDENLGIFG